MCYVMLCYDALLGNQLKMIEAKYKTVSKDLVEKTVKLEEMLQGTMTGHMPTDPFPHPAIHTHTLSLSKQIDERP